MKQVFGILAVLIFVSGAGYVFYAYRENEEISNFEECVAAGYPVAESYPRRCLTPDRVFTEYISEIQPKLDPRLELTAPATNALVESPLIISGRARGYWYFEASFPIRVRDASGRELGVAVAQAEGEWMTEDFVPFHATLYFDPPTTDTGILILERDNPSGLPEHDASVEIPIRFKKSAVVQNPMTVKIFLGTESLAAGTFDCAEVEAVDRVVERTIAPARSALEALFRGPTGSEIRNGYFTAINPGVRIQALVIQNGIARVDFSQELEEGVGGSCRVTTIRRQITETLKQFPTVQSVAISIDGRTDDILQP